MGFKSLVFLCWYFELYRLVSMEFKVLAGIAQNIKIGNKINIKQNSRSFDVVIVINSGCLLPKLVNIYCIFGFEKCYDSMIVFKISFFTLPESKLLWKVINMFLVRDNWFFSLNRCYTFCKL